MNLIKIDERNLAMCNREKESRSASHQQDLMNRSDWDELYERRLSEKLISRTETQLRKRYGWLILVVTFLTGGGSFLIVKSTLSNAMAQIKVANYIGMRAEEKLQELSKALDTVEDTAARVRELEAKAKVVKHQYEKNFQTLSEFISKAQSERLVPLYKGTKQERIKNILGDIDKLSMRKAIELVEKPPVIPSTSVKRMIALRDPDNKRSTNGSEAKAILKMQITMGNRSDEALSKWEATFKHLDPGN